MKKQADIFDTLAAQVDERDIDQYTEDNYLVYAWSVCLDRALVYAEDGLKPIHRKILYTAYKNGITDKSAKMKSANFEGEVMKYSPHGGCFVGSTKLLTAELGNVTLEELCELFKDKTVSKLHTISYTPEGLQTGIISNVWVTKYVDKLIRLQFSDGTIHEVTPNHPFLTRQGEFIPAEYLPGGASVYSCSFTEEDNLTFVTDNDSKTSFVNGTFEKCATDQPTNINPTVTLLLRTEIRLPKSIPVYDFTEDRYHNAFVVSNEIQTPTSLLFTGICVHNSYNAMVNLGAPEVEGQPRPLRVPLLRFKGSIGGISSPPAAARYTEVGLFPAAMELLKELDEDVVDLVPNYNGTLTEPVFLPARFPVALINGVTDAMAVGFASNLPCHNPDEVMRACIALLQDDTLTNKDLMEFVKAPDFQCGCDILPYTVQDGKKVDGVKKYLETGSGSFIMRATCEMKNDNGKYTLSFKHLPYKVSPEKVLEEIKKQYEKGAFQELSSWKDLSDIKDPVNLVVTTKKNININKVLADLYKLTSLQTNFAANCTIVLNHTPSQLSLKDILSSFIEFRKKLTKRKLEHRLAKKQKQLKMKEAVQSVLVDLDACIAIIRKAKDEDVAKTQLMKKFNLSDEQATFILSLQLRKLTKADSYQIKTDIKDLKSAIKELNKLLTKKDAFIQFIVGELEDTRKVISSPRLCKVVKDGELDEEIKDVYLSVDGRYTTRSFKSGGSKVNEEGQILVVSRDGSCVRSVYTIPDETRTIITKLKGLPNAMTVVASDGYLLVVDKTGRARLVDLNGIKFPKKDKIDLLPSSLVLARPVKDTNFSLLINGKKVVKGEDIPIQKITARLGKKIYSREIETIDFQFPEDSSLN